MLFGQHPIPRGLLGIPIFHNRKTLTTAESQMIGTSFVVVLVVRVRARSTTGFACEPALLEPGTRMASTARGRFHRSRVNFPKTVGSCDFTPGRSYCELPFEMASWRAVSGHFVRIRFFSARNICVTGICSVSVGFSAALILIKRPKEI